MNKQAISIFCFSIIASALSGCSDNYKIYELGGAVYKMNVYSGITYRMENGNWIEMEEDVHKVDVPDWVKGADLKKLTDRSDIKVTASLSRRRLITRLYNGRDLTPVVGFSVLVSIYDREGTLIGTPRNYYVSTYVEPYSVVANSIPLSIIPSEKDGETWGFSVSSVIVPNGVSEEALNRYLLIKEE